VDASDLAGTEKAEDAKKAKRPPRSGRQKKPQEEPEARIVESVADLDAKDGLKKQPSLRDGAQDRPAWIEESARELKKGVKVNDLEVGQVVEVKMGEVLEVGQRCHIGDQLTGMLPWEEAKDGFLLEKLEVGSTAKLRVLAKNLGNVSLLLTGRSGPLARPPEVLKALGTPLLIGKEPIDVSAFAAAEAAGEELEAEIVRMVPALVVRAQKQKRLRNRPISPRLILALTDPGSRKKILSKLEVQFFTADFFAECQNNADVKIGYKLKVRVKVLENRGQLALAMYGPDDDYNPSGWQRKKADNDKAQEEQEQAPVKREREAKRAIETAAFQKDTKKQREKVEAKAQEKQEEEETLAEEDAKPKSKMQKSRKQEEEEETEKEVVPAREEEAKPKFPMQKRRKQEEEEEETKKEEVVPAREDQKDPPKKETLFSVLFGS